MDVWFNHLAFSNNYLNWGLGECFVIIEDELSR